jgi:hypothetical protein
MRDHRPREQQLNDLLEGKLGESSADLERLRKLAGALQPASRPAPSAQFRARLRNELLARASETSEDVFAALLDGIEFDAPAELQPLMAVAAALEPASLPVPRANFRYRLRDELLTAAENQGVSVGGRIRDRFAAINERMRRSLRTVVATGTLAALIAGSGATMAAAAHALPGDALYPVKLFRESAQLAVTSGTQDGLRRLKFARERMSELKGLEERGNTEAPLYIATLDRMDSLTQAGTTTLIQAARNGEGAALLKKVRTFTSVQEQDLKALMPQLPVAAQPFARDSLIELSQVTHTVKDVLNGCPCNPPSNPLAPRTGSGSSSSVGCSCNTTSQGTPSTTGGSSSTSSTGSTTTNGSQGSSGDNNNSSTTEPGQQTIVDQVVPDVPGTDLDDQVENLVDQILTSPSPLPSLPLPLPSVSLSVGNLNVGL